MVITLTSQVDGNAQPVAIEGQEGQDPDEPPIRLPSPTLENHNRHHSPVSSLQEGDTATNSVIYLEGKDGSLTASLSWDGSSDTAHVSSGKSVATHLGVDPQYVLISGHNSQY